MNTTDGTLTSATDPNGQIVSYAYDAAKRVTSVTATADGKTYTNAYTYENDRIKTVSHNTTSNTSNDVTYTFDYDALGRKTTVKVGSKTLSTNVYGTDRSGLLTEVQYGNGGKVKYTYDDYDRMTGVKYDSETADRYTYEYDASGNAVLVRDNNLGRVLQTEHDLTDRPMGTQLRNTNGSLIYRTELDYDNQNRLVGFGEEAEGNTYKTSYTYDNDNRVTEIGFGGSDKVKYTYDNLGRLSGRIVENGTDAGKIDTSYTFIAGGHGDNSTTPLIAKIEQPKIPFEYEETGLHYLRSRYYNPEWGRFVNADTAIIADIFLCHSFSYCSNNPINVILRPAARRGFLLPSLTKVAYSYAEFDRLTGVKYDDEVSDR